MWWGDRMHVFGFAVLVIVKITASHAEVIPAELNIYEIEGSTFGSYPNPLNITLEETKTMFHPVVKFGKASAPVLDLRSMSGGIAPESDRNNAEKRSTDWKNVPFRWTFRRFQKSKTVIGIGMYDENRAALYDTDHFKDTDNQIDGYGGARTVHLGIDLNAPAGTPVFAFCDGVIHSAGYNEPLGDYGNVIVIEHTLPHGNSKQSGALPTKERKVWALYGHLGSDGISKRKPGETVRKGQIIGRIGDIHENGGWVVPHLHFQLSIHPPATHDMPGASSVEDRPRALVHFPDPRYILGPIY